MVNLYGPKKPAPTAGKANRKMAQSKPKDWHPADVIAALHKRHVTLRGLAIRNGYEASATRKALRKPWPAIERLVAAAVGETPQSIWPSRYHDDGTPKRGRINGNSSTRGRGRNVHSNRAA